MMRRLAFALLACGCGTTTADRLPQPDAGEGGDAEIARTACEPNSRDPWSYRPSSCKNGFDCCPDQSDAFDGGGYCCVTNYCIDDYHCSCGDLPPMGDAAGPGCLLDEVCCPLGMKYYGKYCLRPAETPNFTSDHCFYPK